MTTPRDEADKLVNQLIESYTKPTQVDQTSPAAPTQPPTKVDYEEADFGKGEGRIPWTGWRDFFKTRQFKLIVFTIVMAIILFFGVCNRLGPSDNAPCSGPTCADAVEPAAPIDLDPTQQEGAPCTGPAGCGDQNQPQDLDQQPQNTNTISPFCSGLSVGCRALDAPIITGVNDTMSDGCATMRSGPGAENSEIGCVSSGTSVSVRAVADDPIEAFEYNGSGDRCYIQSADGTQNGWIACGCLLEIPEEE